MGESECVREGGTWEIIVPYAQFCCEPETALKNSLFLSPLTKFGNSKQCMQNSDALQKN